MWRTRRPMRWIACCTRDRLDGSRDKRTYLERLAALPDGCMVQVDGAAWLVQPDSLVRWSLGGLRRAAAARVRRARQRADAPQRRRGAAGWLPAGSGSDPCLSRAALAGCARRDGDDLARGTGGHAVQLERAARAVRRDGRRGDERAVAAQRDLPRHAVAVLVDLELDLDAAILAAQLELGGRALGAGAAYLDAVAALGGGDWSRRRTRWRTTASATARVMMRVLNMVLLSVGTTRSLAVHGSGPQCDIGPGSPSARPASGDDGAMATRRDRRPSADGALDAAALRARERRRDRGGGRRRLLRAPLGRDRRGEARDADEGAGVGAARRVDAPATACSRASRRRSRPSTTSSSHAC